MSNLKAYKAFNSSSDVFNKTEIFTIMHCGNIEGNNNKFFCIELQKNETTNEYRIFTHYGRLNKSSVYDIRGPLSDYNTIKKEYDSIIRKKLKGKKIKDDDGTVREEKYVIVDVLGSNVGSDNIRKTDSVIVSNKKSSSLSMFDLMNYSSNVKLLLKQLLEENVHNVMTNTSLKYTCNGFETPLGPVTKDHILNARNVLLDLKNCNDLSYENNQVRHLNNLYFSMIPHDFGHKIKQDDMILSNDKLVYEFDLLDQLDAAISVSNSSDNEKQDIGLDIEDINDKGLYEYLHKKYTSSRKHSQLSNWKINNIYKLNNHSQVDKYNNNELVKSKQYQEYDLFHGSRNSNILSIMINGFMIPPVSAPHVTGRMFGNGVYGASSSTKSLNYSTGFWGGRNNKYDNAFLFIVRFCMGNTYETYHKLSSGAPKGYHSIHAKAGQSLINDEFIVYDPSQTMTMYLLELNK